MTCFWVLYSDWRSVTRFFLCPLHKGTTALTLNPSPKIGRGTLDLAPLLSKLGEGARG